MTTTISRQNDAGSCARTLLSLRSIFSLGCLDAPALLPPPAGIPWAHRDTKGWRLNLYLVLIVLVVVLVCDKS